MTTHTPKPAPDIEANELTEFASLMVDELIARVRKMLDEGQPLSLHDQKCLLEQLASDRSKLGLAKPEPSAAGLVEELLREARDLALIAKFETSKDGARAAILIRKIERVLGLARSFP